MHDVHLSEGEHASNKVAAQHWIVDGDVLTDDTDANVAVLADKPSDDHRQLFVGDDLSMCMRMRMLGTRTVQEASGEV